MRLKNENEILDELIKKFSQKKDNVYYLNRLFVANTVIRWIFRETSQHEEILQYLMQVERFLKEEIDLYWKNGKIKVARKNGAKDEDARQCLEKI